MYIRGFEKVLFSTDLSKYALKVLGYPDQIPRVSERVRFHVIDLAPSHPPKLRASEDRLYPG